MAASPIESTALVRGEPVAIVQAKSTRAMELGELTDKEFDHALAVLEKRKERVSRILDHFLVAGVHYGSPVDSRGKPIFKKPILYQAGAEELRSTFGCRLVSLADPVVIATAEFTSVRVMIGIEDRMGRLLAYRSGACNSKEKRFKKKDGSGDYVFDDAREVLHDCVAMAEKRGGTLATREAFGLTGYLGAEEEEDKEKKQRSRPAAAHASPTPAAPTDATTSPATGDPLCPVCQGLMWNNIATKTNPKAPDYKCRDKACEGKYWPGQWPPKDGELFQDDRDLAR